MGQGAPLPSREINLQAFGSPVELPVSANVVAAIRRAQMKLLTAAICLVSVGVLSGCVDDRGYRSGGYYSTGVTYRDRDRDRDRYYRDYNRGDRNWRDNRGNRGNTIYRPPVASGQQEYGVLIR